MNKQLQDLFKSEELFLILHTIMHNPNCSTGTILKRTKISKTSTHRHLQKLENMDVIIKFKEEKNLKHKRSYRYRSNIKKLQITLTKDKFSIIT